MKELRNAFILTIICVLLLSTVFTGCSKQGVNEDELWVYKPMISKGNNLFGDTGYTKEKLSEEWLMVGKIEKEVPQYEPMVKSETYYVSNTLPVGTEIYGSEEESNIIYAKLNSTFIKYELMEDNPD